MVREAHKPLYFYLYFYLRNGTKNVLYCHVYILQKSQLWKNYIILNISQKLLTIMINMQLEMINLYSAQSTEIL